MDAASATATPGGRPDGHLSHDGRLSPARHEMTNGRDERPRRRSRSRSRRRRGRSRSRSHDRRRRRSRDRSRSRRERRRDDDDYRRRDRDRRDGDDRRDRDRRHDDDAPSPRREDRRPQRLRPNASSFGAFLKGFVRERERADDELRRAADKQLARIEFGE